MANTTLKYPCMVISGLTLMDEVVYLQNHQCHIGTSMQLYINFQGQIFPLNKADLELRYLLLLKDLSPKDEPYEVKIYMNENTSKNIDWSNPESLLLFAKL